MPTDEEILSAYKNIAQINAEPEEVSEALNYAKRKLRRIIDRYGDADGIRLTAKYAAILVDEEVRAEIRERYTFERCARLIGEEPKEKRGTSYTMPMFIRELAKAKVEIKKGRSAQETTNQEITHLNYNALTPDCQ